MGKLGLMMAAGKKLGSGAGAGAAGAGAAGAGASGGAGLLSKLGSSGGGASKVSPQQITGIATAALQGLYAVNQKKKANAVFPELVDPNQASYLAELGQKKAALTTGADVAEGMDTLDRSQASANDAISRNAGGNAGGAIQGLLSAQSNTNIGKNQVLAGAYNNQMGLNNAYGNMLNLISMKKQSLQLRREQELRAEYSSAANGALNNFLAAVAQKKPGEVQSTPPVQPVNTTIPTGVPSLNNDVIETPAPMVTPSPEKTLSSLSLGTPITFK